MKRYSYLATASLLSALLGCSRAPQWDDADRQPISSFAASLELVNEAHSVSNASGPGISRNGEMARIVALYERAYELSKKTTKTSLAKAHSDLPEKYKNYFQEGVRLRLEGWKTENPNFEIQGSALMDSWGDWYQKNQLKIPKRMVSKVE